MKHTIAAINQKGGVGKTTTVHNLAVGIAKRGYRVLAIDTDPQGSLTTVMGYESVKLKPEDTISGLIAAVDQDGECADYGCILHTGENVDLIPANEALTNIQIAMNSMTYREKLLTRIIDGIKDNYDYILIDGQPSLNTMTINALTAATDILIPAQAATLSTHGIAQMLTSINKIKRVGLNADLNVAGIVFTMANTRINQYKTIRKELDAVLGNNIHTFDTVLPFSLKSADEADHAGESLFKNCPKSKLAIAYDALVTEVLKWLA